MISFLLIKAIVMFIWHINYRDFFFFFFFFGFLWLLFKCDYTVSIALALTLLGWFQCG